MSNHSFVIDRQQAAQVAAGDRLSIQGSEAHHALNVKRVKPGEHLDLLDGHGRRLVVEVQDGDRQALHVTVLEVVDEAPPGHPVTLIQALAKGDRDLQAVEASVELGVSAVRPWQAERSIVRWNAAKAQKAQEKWRSQVRSAQKQSRRSYEPVLHPMLTTRQLAEEVSARTADGHLVLVLHEAATVPLGRIVGDWKAAAGTAGRTAPGVCLIVGPEGGISDGELAVLTAAGARAVVLGQHVLRASTAGPAALVLVRHLLGDL